MFLVISIAPMFARRPRRDRASTISAIMLILGYATSPFFGPSLMAYGWSGCLRYWGSTFSVSNRRDLHSRGSLDVVACRPSEKSVTSPGTGSISPLALRVSDTYRQVAGNRILRTAGDESAGADIEGGHHRLGFFPSWPHVGQRVDVKLAR